MRRLGIAAAIALLACGREAPAPAEAPAAPLLRGQALFQQDLYDSAWAAFRVAAAEAESAGDSAGRARALTWSSRAAYRIGNYPAAREEGEAALALKQRLGLTGELFESWNTLGLLAWNQGRLVDAESLLASASRAAEAAGDSLGMGKAAANRGLVQVELGDYRAARAGFEVMRGAGERAGDARVHGNALANLAMLDIREGSPRAALPRLTEARRLYGQIGYGPGEANALGQLATAWRDMGRYELALAAADSALALARRLGLRQEEAAELEVIATLHLETGDLSAALLRLTEAQAINQELELEVERGTGRRREGAIRLELGQAAGAIEDGLAALHIHAAAGARPERLEDLLFLARADSARAADWLRQARALADSLHSQRASAGVRLTDAQVAIRAHDWPTAFRALEAEAASPSPREPIFRWQLAEARAQAYEGAGNRSQALRAARDAVAAVERVRGSLGASWSRARFLESRSGTYARLVELLLASGKPEEAFRVADAARGRAVLEHLAGVDPAEAGPGRVLPALVAGERALRLIDEVETQLAALEDPGPETAAARERLRARLVTLQADYREAMVVAAAPAAVVLGLGGVELAGLRRALAPDEAVVEYLVGGERLHAFVVGPRGLGHVLLPLPSRDLAERVRVARDLAGRPGPATQASPVLGALHADLVAPLEAAGLLAQVRRLVVIPQGVLSYLPFAALYDAAAGGYLVERYVLSTAPSAAGLVSLRGRSHGAVATGVIGLAPFPDELPGTAAELEGIGRVAPLEALRGPAATETAARRLARDPRILHLATHGVLNPDNPLFSWLELRSSGAGTGDGRLEVHEVLGLSVGAPLVYLSGCETALGPLGAVSRGDDLVTLGQSFLFAGARSVIATVWRIPDAASARLVEAFYQRLPGMPAPDALAGAQRELLRTMAPYYWAGYVLSGDGR